MRFLSVKLHITNPLLCLFMKQAIVLLILSILIISCKQNHRKDKGVRVLEYDSLTGNADLNNKGRDEIKNRLSFYTSKQNGSKDIDTFLFDPVLLKIDNINGEYFIKKVLKRSDSCFFYLYKKGSDSKNRYRFECDKYRSFIKLLDEKNIVITTIINNSGEKDSEILHDRPSDLCGTYQFRESRMDSLNIKFSGFTFGFNDKSIFFLHKRIIVNNKMFGVFNNGECFVIVSWKFKFQEPEFIGLTDPFNLITLENYEAFDRIFQIDSLHYLIKGDIPEIDYTDGPTQWHNYSHVWFGIIEHPNTIYFITGCERLAIIKKFSPFYCGDAYSYAFIREINDSLLIFEHNYGLCDEEEWAKLLEGVPEDELEGADPCPVADYTIMDTLDLNYIKNLLDKIENKHH